MKNSALYYIWGGLAVLCALLGLIPTPSGALAVVMTMLSVGFFVPPAWLLIDAYKTGCQKTLKTLRLISIISLGATLLLFVANILAVLAPEALGNVLYFLLAILSVPMVCSGHYVLSLFLWACILICSLPKKKLN